MTYNRFKAFSLIETITVLVIAVMVIISAINIYGRVKQTAASIDRRIQKRIFPEEILQLITEDLDRLAAAGFDTAVNFENKFSNKFNLCRLVIENRIYDSNKREQTFEKVTWQSAYDPYLDALTIYRAHSGINSEDKVLDTSQKNDNKSESELFVPIAEGVTWFRITVPQPDDRDPLDRWTVKTMPNSLHIELSFAEPFETVGGYYEVYEEDIISRTVAIDRTRQITYRFIPRKFDYDTQDPNNTENAYGFDSEEEQEESEYEEETEEEMTE